MVHLRCHFLQAQSLFLLPISSFSNAIKICDSQNLDLGIIPNCAIFWPQSFILPALTLSNPLLHKFWISISHVPFISPINTPPIFPFFPTHYFNHILVTTPNSFVFFSSCITVVYQNLILDQFNHLLPAEFYVLLWILLEKMTPQREQSVLWCNCKFLLFLCTIGSLLTIKQFF